MKTSFTILSAAILLTLSLFGAEQPDAAWPGWRGPSHDGHAPVNCDPPVAWPAALRVVWQTDVGAGFSSPISDGSRVFLQHRSPTEEYVSAFDAATGRKLWQTTLATLIEPQTHDPAATPCVSGESIFVHSVAGAVLRMNSSDGKQIWKREFASEWKGAKFRPFYGVAASPLLDGDTVVLPIGDTETGKIVALKQSDGATAWEQATSAPGYGSTVPLTLGGQSCLATLLYHELVVLKKTGARVEPGFSFKLPGGGDGNSATPLLIGENRLLITSHEATVALNVQPGATRCDEAWRLEAGGDLSSPVFANGRVYLHNSSELLCIDPTDGKTLSHIAMDGQYCALIVWGSVLICRLHDGAVKCVDIRDASLKVLAAYPPPQDAGESWSAPMPLTPTSFVMRAGTKLLRLSIK